MSSILMQPRHVLATILVVTSVLLSPRCTVAASQLTLSWIDNSTDENGFTIERKSGTDGYAYLATTAANVTSFVDTPVDDGVSYCYRVQSFNAGGGSGYSNEACGSTTSPPPPVSQEFAVSVSVAGQGTVSSNPASINCPGTCQTSFSSQASVVLTAIPSTGWQFSGWGGSCTGTVTTCSLTMDQAKTVTASFVQSSSPPPPTPEQFTLSVSSIVGQGSVTSNPAGINCPGTCQTSFSSQASVVLMAAPSAGWKVSGWGGSCTGKATTCSLTMNQKRDVTVTFVRTTGTQTTLSTIGVFRSGVWLVDNGNFQWEGCAVDTCVVFGKPGDQPVMGYWETSRRKQIGVFRDGAWYLDNGNRRFDGCGGGDTCLSFGEAGDQAVVGDWDGDGRTEIGVFRNGDWYLDTNGNGRLDSCRIDKCISGFGLPGDQAVTGDWDGDGRTEIGVFRNGDWYLDTNGNGRWDEGKDTHVKNFGQVGDQAAVGDWDKDKRSQIGVFRRDEWHLDNGDRVWGTCSVDKCVIGIGTFGDLPISKGP